MPIWSAEIKEIESLYGAHPKEYDLRQVKPVLKSCNYYRMVPEV